MKKHSFSWFNHEKILRPETRVDTEIVCPRCRSAHVIKDNHKCGRAVCADSCEAKEKDCEDLVSSKQFTQRYRCLECGNKWATISSM